MAPNDWHAISSSRYICEPTPFCATSTVSIPPFSLCRAPSGHQGTSSASQPSAIFAAPSSKSIDIGAKRIFIGCHTLRSLQCITGKPDHFWVLIRHSNKSRTTPRANACGPFRHRWIRGRPRTTGISRGFCVIWGCGRRAGSSSRGLRWCCLNR
jgi:hypothetical protein